MPLLQLDKAGLVPLLFSISRFNALGHEPPLCHELHARPSEFDSGREGHKQLDTPFCKDGKVVRGSELVFAS